MTRLWGRHIQLEALQRHGNFSTISNAKPLCRNLNYWDSVSTLAGEVAHPKRTFPRALGIAVALVVAMYVGPLLIGLGVTTQSSDWELGYFTRVAQIVRFSILLLSWCSAFSRFTLCSRLASYNAALPGEAQQGLGHVDAICCRENLCLARLGPAHSWLFGTPAPPCCSCRWEAAGWAGGWCPPQPSARLDSSR